MKSYRILKLYFLSILVCMHIHAEPNSNDTATKTEGVLSPQEEPPTGKELDISIDSTPPSESEAKTNKGEGDDEKTSNAEAVNEENTETPKAETTVKNEKPEKVEQPLVATEPEKKKNSEEPKSIKPQTHKTIFDIQKFLMETKLETSSASYKLINLNTHINSWFYAAQIDNQSKKQTAYHFENIDPTAQLSLKQKEEFAVLAINNKGQTKECDIFSEDINKQVAVSLKTKEAYTKVCDNQIFIRNFTPGRQSAKEAVTSFLRKYVWGGESITNFVKTKFFQDKFLIDSGKDTNQQGANVNHGIDNSAPLDGRIDPEYLNKAIIEPKHLGITLKKAPENNLLTPGHWYTTLHNDHIYLSAIQPTHIEKALFETHKDKVSKLDNIESNALVYLLAVNIDKFAVDYMIGTDHPSVEWSTRVLDEVRDNSIPGPDGIATIEPLVGTGRVDPLRTKDVIAAFVGGFKRNHAAFKWGPLREINHGSHYGVIESGVIMSRLNPGLATMYIDKSGRFDMKTWSEEDNKSLLPTIKHARQNGVSIIEGKDESGGSIPGEYVDNWGDGNWSGSVDAKQRALRAAACLQESQNGRFLIYGYFSSATPNAMARVFQAYKCTYAIHLDMNALEHTYLATYFWEDDKFNVEHLIEGMHVLDSKYEDRVIPRFLGMSDNRDFFYIYKKGNVN